MKTEITIRDEMHYKAAVLQNQVCTLAAIKALAGLIIQTQESGKQKELTAYYEQEYQTQLKTVAESLIADFGINKH